jgi:hypothetical protein
MPGSFKMARKRGAGRETLGFISQKDKHLLFLFAMVKSVIYN